MIGTLVSFASFSIPFRKGVLPVSKESINAFRRSSPVIIRSSFPYSSSSSVSGSTAITASIARENFRRAGKGERITLLEGDAAEILQFRLPDLLLSTHHSVSLILNQFILPPPAVRISSALHAERNPVPHRQDHRLQLRMMFQLVQILAHTTVDRPVSSGVRVHVTANILAHNYDLEGAGRYFQELKALRPDALIIADP